jgi:hypothetical protein
MRYLTYSNEAEIVPVVKLRLLLGLRPDTDSPRGIGPCLCSAARVLLHQNGASFDARRTAFCTLEATGTKILHRQEGSNASLDSPFADLLI